ncbi:hypothetical protein [Aquimarina megaterium]|uniref:hypothetical protein n=1 Tax=Aquimarina megaterium TaxID=1443666 RepID=UPI0009446D51|nr:hypothetical protein [Aquimarina megaterium]
MEEIINVIEKIILKEYELLMAYLNPDLLDEEYEQIYNDYKEYFHFSLDSYLHMYSVRDKDLFSNPEDIEMYKNSYQKRIVFQIAKYLNPNLGKELATHIDVKEIYVCYLNSNQVSGRPTLSFNDTYTIAKLGNDFKVIYRELFMLEKWERPHGYEPSWIIDYGKLEEVNKIISPQEDQSLIDYNKI